MAIIFYLQADWASLPVSLETVSREGVTRILHSCNGCVTDPIETAEAFEIESDLRRSHAEPPVFALPAALALVSARPELEAELSLAVGQVTLIQTPLRVGGIQVTGQRHGFGSRGTHVGDEVVDRTTFTGLRCYGYCRFGRRVRSDPSRSRRRS